MFTSYFMVDSIYVSYRERRVAWVATCIMELMDSRSVRISLRVLVPRMLRSVVCASSCVDLAAFSTLTTEMRGLEMR